MQIVIVLIHLFIVLTMIGVVLLQKSEGGGLGIGSTGGFLSRRGTSHVLPPTTAALAAPFFATRLALPILGGWDRHPSSIIPHTPPAAPQTPGGVALKVRSHGAVYLHHRRRGLLPRQGSRIRSARRAAAGARLQGTAAQARPLSQRRSRDDVALPARRGFRHR